jgi:octanoyl-[GcvH]:protein N-octanoyltransferase
VTGPFGDGAVRLAVDGEVSTPRRDMELSTQLLADLARPEVAGRLRVHLPQPTAAFSRLDTLAAGFPDAERAARTHGFEPVVRPAGGRLAAYHQGALVLDLVARHPVARNDFRARFAVLGQCLIDGLQALGVPARVGAVPGEYCPGEFSVNAAGATKLVGTAQRLTRHGFLLSAVLLVSDPEPVRAVLTDTYALLGLAWRPETVGCVADHVPGITPPEVWQALLPRLRQILALSDDSEVTKTRSSPEAPSHGQPHDGREHDPDQVDEQLRR